jgi:ATP-dependent Clp protease ATP-binding subunit ClpA
MYERFTDRARKVMQLANQEAQRFNHEYIGTEHILLGLVKEGSGVAANVLKNLDIDLRKIRLEVEKIVQTGSGEMVSMGKLPHTPRAKKVIEEAINSSKALGYNYVGTEHLLMGMLLEKEGVAATVLMNLGLMACKVEATIVELLASKKRDEQPASSVGPAFLNAEGLGPIISLPLGVHVIPTREAAILLSDRSAIITAAGVTNEEFAKAVHAIHRQFIDKQHAVLPVGYSIRFEPMLPG